MVPRLCRKLLCLVHLCNNACNVVNLQHLLRGDPMHKETSWMLQTSQFNEDPQARVAVLFIWTTQNLCEMHTCNNGCIVWIRQSSRVWRACEKSPGLDKVSPVWLQICSVGWLRWYLSSRGSQSKPEDSRKKVWMKIKCSMILHILIRSPTGSGTIVATPLNFKPKLVKWPCGWINSSYALFQQHLTAPNLTSLAPDSRFCFSSNGNRKIIESHVCNAHEDFNSCFRIVEVSSSS